MTTLNQYEFDVADLLHDPTNLKWTLTQLDSYINEARRQLVRDTGCLRNLQQSFVTQGQEQYTFGQVTGGVVVTGGTNYTGPSVAFAGGGGTGVAATLSQSGGAVNTISFTNFGSGYSSVPSNIVSDIGAGAGALLQFGIINVNTYDVLDVHVYQGNQRIPVDWLPFRRFTARFRPFTTASYQRMPAAWAVYGDTQIFLGPTPDQSYSIELDTIILPTPFTVGDYATVDPIPVVTQDAIKFYAAYRAKFNAQSYGEAETHFREYKRLTLEATALYTGRIPDTSE